MKAFPTATLALTVLLSGCSSSANEPQISPEENQRITNQETQKKYEAFVKCINDTYVSLGKDQPPAGVDGTRESILQFCASTTGHQR
jgi:hypothetical protein